MARKQTEVPAPVAPAPATPAPAPSLTFRIRFYKAPNEEAVKKARDAGKVARLAKSKSELRVTGTAADAAAAAADVLNRVSGGSEVQKVTIEAQGSARTITTL